jgi:hypothetical protein
MEAFNPRTVRQIDADLSAARTKRDAIAKKLEAARADAATKQSALADLAIAGDDAGLTRAERAHRDAGDRVSTLIAASEQLDAQIDAREAARVEAADRETRQATSAALIELAEGLENEGPKVISAMTKFARLLSAATQVEPVACNSLQFFVGAITDDGAKHVLEISQALRGIARSCAEGKGQAAYAGLTRN